MISLSWITLLLLLFVTSIGTYMIFSRVKDKHPVLSKAITKLEKEYTPKTQPNDLSKEMEKSLDSRHRSYNVDYVKQSSSSDSIQDRGNVLKKGFCYVGVDNGTRGCVKVYKDDTCMSGNVYPTMEICMNPNLRLGD